MKHLKIMLSMAALMLALTFTSCLSSNNDYEQYYSWYATVVNGSQGSQELIADNGIKLKASYASLLFLKDSKRALITFKLAEGVVPTDDAKEYDVIIDQERSAGLKTSPLLTTAQPDTLLNLPLEMDNYDQGRENTIWTVAPGETPYLTGIIHFVYAPNKTYFDVFRESPKSNADTLFLKLNYNTVEKEANRSAYTIISYELPSKSELRNEFYQKDSIVVCLTARVKKSDYGKETVDQKFCNKIKLSY